MEEIFSKDKDSIQTEAVHCLRVILMVKGVNIRNLSVKCESGICKYLFSFFGQNNNFQLALVPTKNCGDY